jgi:hypothetical protein
VQVDKFREKVPSAQVLLFAVTAMNTELVSPSNRDPVIVINGGIFILGIPEGT